MKSMSELPSPLDRPRQGPVKMIRQCSLIAVLMAAMSCKDVPTASPATVAIGGTAALASYALSTSDGDYYDDGNGELVPGGIWPAPIKDQVSWIDASCGGSGCDFAFHAQHQGLWHFTKIEIQWSINGQGSTISKQGWGACILPVGIYCLERVFSAVHETRLSERCGWEATQATDHTAWWGSYFNISLRYVTIGVVGPNAKSSIAAPRSASCLTNGGGGGEWGEVCYDLYLAWTDVLGYHEEYIGTLCWQQWEA